MLEAPAWADSARMATYCADSIARATAVRERLRAPGRAAAEVVTDFNQLSIELDTAAGLASLQFNVNPDKAYRDAAQKCEQDLSKFATEVSLDRGLYDALVAVDPAGLDALGQRFVTESLRDFRRAGVDKDEATRKRITDINARMVELEQEYSKNISEDVRSIEVDDATKLAGLPQDWLDNHKPNADGKIVVTTDYPDFYPFQSYVADDGLRRALYTAFLTRAFPKNTDILKEVLSLRAEKARLLGFTDWAAYIIDDKMAKSAEAVDAFITDITGIIRPRSEADLKLLLARKQKDQPAATAIEDHDRFYYVGMVQKEQFDFDPQSVRPYFSYPAVKRGILDLYGELFNLEFKQVEGAVAWHPSVESYEMWADGQLVGRFFLDMHARPDKYKHAAAFEIQSGSTTRIPWASLVCNFPNPADGDGKALMEHDDVVTFFHEFGHLIHHLISRTGPYIDLTGFNVEWDFVEVPSQMLEEWAWSHEVLARFAKHVETGEAISAETVAKMKAANEFGKGLHLMRQVLYTAYSFHLHKADPATLDLDAFTDDIYSRFSPFPRLADSKVYASFGHLMGYSAIYYTYQWSLAIEKDLFTRFKAEGLMNKDVALAYRKEVLEPGGTKDADELVRAFLGRERNLDAYKTWIQAE